MILTHPQLPLVDVLKLLVHAIIVLLVPMMTLLLNGIMTTVPPCGFPLGCQPNNLAKKPIKDLHGNALPNDTTLVIEDLSTPERPLYTKQLIAADHGVTWQYALQAHPRSLHRRLQLYSAPSPLYHLAARAAYAALCNTHSTLVLPSVERFRQDLQNSAFFALCYTSMSNSPLRVCHVKRIIPTPRPLLPRLKN